MTSPAAVSTAPMTHCCAASRSGPTDSPATSTAHDDLDRPDQEDAGRAQGDAHFVAVGDAVEEHGTDRGKEAQRGHDDRSMRGRARRRCRIRRSAAMIAIATIDTGTRIRTIVNVIAFGTK